MRQGPRRPRYPMQQTVPSQQPPNTPAYDPVVQPDVEQFRNERGRAPWGVPKNDSFVLPVFDSLPINAFNTVITNQNFDDGVNFDNFLAGDGDPARLLYRVPQGRVFFLRQFMFMYGQIQNTSEGGGFFDIDGFQTDGGSSGTSNEVPSLSILVDGTFQDGLTELRYRNAVSEVYQPCFVIASEGSLVELRITVNSSFQFLNVDMRMYGNTLLATGRDPALEPGTDQAQAVKQGRPDQ